MPAGLVLALSLCNVVATMDRNLFSLLLTPIKTSLGLGDTELGLLQGTGFALLYALAVVPAGLLADRLDRRRLLAAGLGLWSMGILSYALAPGFSALFAASLVVGLGQAVLQPCVLPILVQSFPARAHGRAIAVFTAGAVAGRATALIGGGAVLAALSRGTPWPGAIEPWRLVILLSLILNALALAAFLASRPPDGARTAPTGADRRHAAALAALRATRPLALRLFLQMSATVLVLQSTVAWAPTLLHRRFDLAPASAALAAGGVMVLAGICGHLAGGGLVDAAGARRRRAAPFLVGAGALATGAPFLALFALAPGLPTALLGLAGFAAAIGAAAPSSLAALQDLAQPAVRGAVTGLMLAAATLFGLGLGPFVVGLVSDGLASGGGALGPALLVVVLPVVALGVSSALSAATRLASRTGAPALRA
ncbi:hypothetical protein ASG48_10460 [Aurantimonas sp. Leaf443]|nr:hypothetical protein ASG48_10460 [Aurantimonas sp. Leaf443]